MLFSSRLTMKSYMRSGVLGLLMLFFFSKGLQRKVVREAVCLVYHRLVPKQLVQSE